MMHTWRMSLTAKDAVFGQYFETSTTDARCMYNVANFYIRNTMTGIQKSPEERTANETEVLHYVFTGIQAANIRTKQTIDKTFREIDEAKGLKKHALLVRFSKKKFVFFEYPTASNWMLSYGALDAIFKAICHPVYKKMVSHVAQNSIRKVSSAWKSYFESLQEYRKSPKKFSGKPQMPGYIKDQKATAWFSAATAILKNIKGKYYLAFAKYKKLFCIGPESLYAGMKYIKTEIKPMYGTYCVMVTFDDKKADIKVPSHPERIIGIDPGLDNFAVVANNFGETPFLIRGGAVKAENQWFNKERTRLMSELTKGKDSTRSVKNSKRLSALSRKRDDFLRDFFYKAAHYICHFASESKADVIVVGHNKNQKKDIGMGHQSNQAFVSVPFCRFFEILSVVGIKYGIPVVAQEESYTSKASLLDMDNIPVYKTGDADEYKFSGCRVKRGLYRSADGTEINADVNGAANILRKKYTYAFEGQEDLGYLYRTTKVVGYKDLYRNAVSIHKEHSKCSKTGLGHMCNKRYRGERKLILRQSFHKEKPDYRKLWKEKQAA